MFALGVFIGIQMIVLAINNLNIMLPFTVFKHLFDAGFSLVGGPITSISDRLIPGMNVSNFTLNKSIPLV
jgi:hypothetical protein